MKPLGNAMHRAIMEDFRKIDASGRAARLFQAIPSELTRNARRYQIGSVINNTSASKIEGTLMDMADSLTVNFAYHSSDPNVGLPLSADYNFFKLFLCDTGLFVTLAFMDKQYTENDIYQKLLSDKLSADLGYVYENVVAQMLRAAGDNLFYYTFKAEVLPTTVNQPTYEIDFLISRSNKICPLEVKSSGYKSHKSLDKFYEKYSARISNRYLLYTKDLSKDQDIICLPVYMIGLL